MLMDRARIEDIAESLVGALDRHHAMPPLTDGMPSLAIEDAYRISGLVMRERQARGERVIGWKIGFTNRAIWEEYGVHAPIWAPMYDTTVSAISPGVAAEISAERFVEPRIEAEVAFRMTAAPQPGMGELELIDCTDAIAHGIEIVQSVYPGWRFAAADTAAAFGLHGCYRHGPWLRIDHDDVRKWRNHLLDFELSLWRNGVERGRGHARNVLGGPLLALKHMVEGFDPAPFGRGIEPGDIVTTGTLTRAFPVQPGEAWTTSIHGIPLKGLTIRFT